ncbi:MAG: LemA family protein [Spirochaetes bacterium]|jgi:LemA protein|nr:LemA family protein [Spirochaetota bacterium]
MYVIIAAGALAVLILWVIITYNRFVALRNMLREAWSGIDVQLKRRYDLIPNLVETVKGYASHEKKLMEEVAALRSRCMGSEGPDAKVDAENALSLGLRKLLAVAEAYPQLRASENFSGLQNSLSEIEDQLQLARRYYNGTARDFNILLESFPSSLVGKKFGFQPAAFFEIESAVEREAPQVRF